MIFGFARDVSTSATTDFASVSATSVARSNWRAHASLNSGVGQQIDIISKQTIDADIYQKALKHLAGQYSTLDDFEIEMVMTKAANWPGLINRAGNFTNGLVQWPN